MGKHLSSHSALSELAARLKAYRIDFPLEEGTQYVSFEYDKVTYVRGDRASNNRERVIFRIWQLYPVFCASFRYGYAKAPDTHIYPRN